MDINLLKVHGSGNTFYLYETEVENEFDWSALAIWLCDAENEGGADGLLLVLPSTVAAAKMRVINADGSEASMCGNGLRCVSRYVCEKLNVESAVIETMKANLAVEKQEPIYLDIPTYGVEISPVSFDLDTLPMVYNEHKTIKHQIIDEFSSTIHYTAVSVPNPHLIGIVDKHYIENSKHQESLAQLLNSENPVCPDGVNLSYVYPIDEESIFVRTYERGVGFTNACGTAMTASALVSKLNNFVTSETITVYNPGGFVKCHVNIENDTYKLQLVGNGTVTAHYVLSASDNSYKWVGHKETEEQSKYELLIEYVRNQLKNVF